MKIIWDSQIVHMVKAISFNIDDDMNQHIFGRKINVDLSKLQKWEGVIKNTWYVKIQSTFDRKRWLRYIRK